MTAPEIKAAAEDHFDQQVVRASRQTYADAEVEFPVRAEVEVDRRKYLVLLVRHSVKTCHRAERPIVFEPHIDSPRDRIADLEVG